MLPYAPPKEGASMNVNRLEYNKFSLACVIGWNKNTLVKVKAISINQYIDIK